MAGALTRNSRRGTLWSLRLLVLCALLAPVLAIASKALAATASDNFNRANGSLGPNWTNISDGGLAIASQAVAGTASAGVSGDIWTAATFTGNQYSQVAVTSTQLTGGQWIGPMVRAQNGGKSAYVGIYKWNNGSPELQLFKRSGSNGSVWTQLGGTYNSGALAAGTQLQVKATGSTIAFLQNGVQRISATDTSLTGGAPGIMSYGTGQVDDWAGGDVPPAFTVGGTVSGLSGMVVLQDNGGDNLSLSANGSFTFATALAGGAAYSVTVLTNPPGQICTVANGSGAIASGNVTNVAVTCTANSATSGSDDFNRANGSLGPSWTDISDGGLAIASQAVAGTASAGVSGDIRTAESYAGNQYSQVAVTSTQLTGGQWIGPMVRAQNGGKSAYVGIYKWNNGGPELQLFKRSGSNGSVWTQLGGTYNSGALAAGTQLQVKATGSTIAFLQNGVQRISATDTSLTGGAPGIMSYGTGQVDNWAGGNVASGGTYTVGGTVSGLSGTVVLQDNGGDNLSLSANGSFTFATALAGGAAYSVTVLTNPPGQICTVANGSGAIASGNVTNVAVTCGSSATYTVGGTVSGLSGTVVLQDNGGDNLSLSANGSFTFATALTNGATYNVTVLTNPSGQICTVANGSGAIASGNVTNVAVTCGSSAIYTVGGTVSGLSGTVVLQDNGGDNLSLSANGSFTFATALTNGAVYNVTVLTNPSGQTCTFTNGSGTIGAANVTNVAVTCTNSTTGSSASDDFNRANGSLGPNWTNISDGGLAIASQAVAGTASAGVSGDIWTAATFTGNQYSQVAVTSTQLTGGQWIGPMVRAQNGGQSAYVGIYYWNNGSPDLMLFKRSGSSWTQLGGTYNSGALAAGTQLQVKATGSTIAFLQNGVQRISATDTSLTGGAPGIMSYGTGQVDNWAGGNVASGGTYTVGGTVSGLSGMVVLQDNGGDNLPLSANGSFTFATALAGGAAYSVTVLTNPPGQICTVANGSGAIASGNVTNVAVTCGSSATYTVGGTVSGLSGTVVLQDNGGDNLSLSANGTFTFATALTNGATYNVTVSTFPTGQTCTITNGSGTIAAANVTNVAVSCTTYTTTPGSDNFNRANGSLGPNWTDISDGGLAIASQAVAGTASAGISGDIQTAESYTSNQYSQVEVTSTQLTGSQWIGPAVRLQNGGQSAYVGIYNWNNGSPDLMLFERKAGTWIQLGTTYNSGPLAAGTQLKLMVVGSTLAFMENGVERIAVGDTDLTGGAPGIVAFGTGQADNWSGGTAGFEVHYLSTDASGVASYDVISANNSDGPHVLRVLKPTNPAPGVPHNFLYVLPVEPGLGNTYGDGLQTMRGLGAQDQYNVTIIEPSFGIDPWYADSATDPAVQYETFMTQELVPWVQANLATTGTEQNWLIGFSKSGIGGQDLILKHPSIFTLAASWDFPADMSSYDQFGADSEAGYGTDANFQSNYRLTQGFVDARKGPFLTNNRIWIGGYSLFGTDVSDYGNLLTSEGIAHSAETPMQGVAHSWDSGWVPLALAALRQDSINMP